MRVVIDLQNKEWKVEVYVVNMQ